MTFEADLRALVSPANVGVEHTVSGVVRVNIKTLINFTALDCLLRTHDMTMLLTAAGQIELRPIGDTMQDGNVDVKAVKTTSVTSGAIREVTRLMPTATSADLAAIAAQPHILSVALASGVVVVNEIIASDLKDGLSHLKYKGRLKGRTTKAKKAWPTTSAALKRAHAKRRRAWW